MKNITIVDDIMGSGKTSWAIQFMNDNPNKRFMYVTPYLNEVDRVEKATTCKQPTIPDKPKKQDTKLNDLKYLLMQEENIVTTHSLLAYFDGEIRDMIKELGYTLILDEVFNVIEQFKVSKADLRLLQTADYFTVSEDGLVRWTGDIEETFSSKTLNEFRNKALAHTLYKYDDNIYYYRFNPKMFLAFDKVYNLTYLFDGQIQKAYYDMFNFKYEYKSVSLIDGKYQLVPFKGYSGAKFKHLINIYDGKLNDVGDKKYALSFSWYDSSKNKKDIEIVRKNNINWYKNIQKTTSDDYFWTCYIKDMPKLKKGIAKSHIPHNIRATNEYADIHNVSYLINRFLNPNEKKIVVKYGLSVNQDLLALSDLLQYLYRSAIRNGQPIYLYIPSSRMRNLLKQWLNDEL